MSTFGVPNFASKPVTAQTQFDQYQNLANAGAGLQYQQYNNTNNSLVNQYANQRMGYGLDYQNQMLGYQGNLGDLNTQIGSNLIQQGTQARDAAYYGKLIGLRQQQFGNQVGQLGLTRDTNLADLLSQETTQGATQTRGNRQQKGFIGQNYNLGVQGADIARQQEQALYGNRQANAQDSLKQLQLEAANLGTKPALLKSQLDNALGQLGLSNKVSTEQIMDGLANNDLNMKMLYLQLMQQFTLPAMNATR